MEKLLPISHRSVFEGFRESQIFQKNTDIQKKIQSYSENTWFDYGVLMGRTLVSEIRAPFTSTNPVASIYRVSPRPDRGMVIYPFPSSAVASSMLVRKRNFHLEGVSCEFKFQLWCLGKLNNLSESQLPFG